MILVLLVYYVAILKSNIIQQFPFLGSLYNWGDSFFRFSMPFLLQDAVLEIQSWQTTGSTTYTSCIISRIFLVLARCRLGIQVSSRCRRSCDAKTSVIGCHAGRCWWWGQRSSNTCHEIWIGTCFLPKIRQTLGVATRQFIGWRKSVFLLLRLVSFRHLIGLLEISEPCKRFLLGRWKEKTIPLSIFEPSLSQHSMKLILGWPHQMSILSTWFGGGV